MVFYLLSEKLINLKDIVFNIIILNLKVSIYKWLLVLFINKMKNSLFFI